MCNLRPCIFLCLLTLAGFVLNTASAADVSNRAPSALEVGYLPAPGEVPAVNPPALAWLNEPGATSWTIEIARERDFARPAVSVKDWPYLLYTHTEPLDPGDYYWRYCFTDKSGKTSGWSQARSFSVATTATDFPRPSAEKLRQLVPDQHPRMFTRPDKLATLRASAETSSPAMQKLLKSADASLKADLMPEPKPWTTGKWNVEEWRAYLKQVGPATSRMDTLAFAWLLTGRDDYGAKAKEHLMNFASWDPKGPSNMKINDEVGMPVMHSVSRTYDWIYPLLSEAEKEQILKVMRIRGEEAYNHMRRKPYEQFVHNSHFGRMWHFLGEAGVAFYGEIPEAEKWLNWSMTIFYGWYPYWGDEDGGWAEGIWYWSSYNTRVTWWLDLMKETMNIDGTRKPFYAGVADFPLYLCPPGHPVAGFGDFSERPVPGSSLASTVAAFALMRQNSAWQWYAEEGGGSLGSGPFGYLRSLRKQTEAKAPVDLPLLKVFQKSGFAAFHTDLTKPDKNLHVAMRCSEYGNVSHSHNDQNAIIMSAYGKPLLVNTGLRDFYSSPFCKEYYWHTRSHNALLIDGEGQQRGQNTTGSLVAHGNDGDRMAFAVGDATRAYGDLAKLYRRWTIFLPDYGAVLVDEVDTTATELSLLFHARVPFTTDDRVGPEFQINNGGVKLQGIISGADQAKINQTDKYPLPLHEGIKPLHDEWHLRIDIPHDTAGNGPVATVVNGRRCIVTFLKVTPKADTEGAAVTVTGSTHEVSGSGNTLRISENSVDGTGLELQLDLEHLSVKRVD